MVILIQQQNYFYREDIPNIPYYRGERVQVVYRTGGMNGGLTIEDPTTYEGTIIDFYMDVEQELGAGEELAIVLQCAPTARNPTGRKYLASPRIINIVHMNQGTNTQMGGIKISRKKTTKKLTSSKKKLTKKTSTKKKSTKKISRKKSKTPRRKTTKKGGAKKSRKSTKKIAKPRIVKKKTVKRR
jgi:hypothetical protein